MHPCDPGDHTIQATEDGSDTVFSSRYQAAYHSRFGAIRESEHVFISSALDDYVSNRCQSLYIILEVGFGTGLNALLTLLNSKKHHRNIHYHSIEKHPLTADTIRALNYPSIGGNSLQDDWNHIHSASWTEGVKLTDEFMIYKWQADILEWLPDVHPDIIYYDAFGPESQPELWTKETLDRICQLLKPGGIWVSYCAKGAVRRSLNALGMITTRLPGPPGKREMLRAEKPI